MLMTSWLLLRSLVGYYIKRGGTALSSSHFDQMLYVQE